MSMEASEPLTIESDVSFYGLRGARQKCESRVIVVNRA